MHLDNSRLHIEFGFGFLVKVVVGRIQLSS